MTGTITTLKRFTGALAVTTAAALAVSLVGCSGQAAQQGAKLTKITVMAPFLSTDAPVAGNEVGAALNKKLGIDLDVTWVPNSSYGDKVNVTLASDKLPDAMVIQGKDPGFVKNAQAGAFWDLGKYLKDYPNLIASNKDVQNNASVNGTIYGIYRPRDVMRTAVMIRKDWLDKLGLQMPKTTDDLYNIAKAFTERDPDGDGKKDTYGLIVPKWPGGLGSNSPWDAIETWFGSGNSWTADGDKLTPSFMTPQWKAALDFEKKLVQGGYTNPDYATLDSASWEQPMVSGKGGIIIDTYSTAYRVNGDFEKADPKTYQGKIAVTGNLTGPDGQLHALPTPGYSGFVAIPKSSVKTEAQLKQVLGVLNKLNDQDVQVLINNGIEGKTYTVKNNLAQPVPNVDQVLNDTVASYAQLGISVSGYKAYPNGQLNDYDQKLWDACQVTMKSDESAAVFNPAAAYVSETAVTKGATLDNIMLDARIKYMAGQIDGAGLDKAIEQWKSTGGTQVIDEINKLYKADGTK